MTHVLRTPLTRAATILLATLLALSAVLLGRPQPVAADTGAVEVTLMATNDVHRQLAPVDNPGGWDDGLGGLAWLSGHLDAVRDRAPDALYVDAGDMTGGGNSGLGLPGGMADEATVEAMNVMGLDATTVGNHEFDGGLAEARRIREGGCWAGDCAYRHDQPYAGAEFATLGANVLDAATGEPVFAPWTIVERQGVDVGIVGVTETSLVNADGVTLLDSFTTANAAAQEAEAAGADIIVVLLHDGSHQNPAGAYDANACEDPTGPSTWMLPWFDDAIDVVVDGHTHQAYVCDIEGLPLMTQASRWGTVFTEITLSYDPATDQVVDRRAVNRQVTHDVTPDPAIAGLVTGYSALIGTNAPSWTDLDGDSLGDAHEVARTQTDPRVADSDGDGIDDGTEVTNGTDPLDPKDPKPARGGGHKDSDTDDGDTSGGSNRRGGRWR